MKIDWNKIPKCFKYAAISDRDNNVAVFMVKPQLIMIGLDQIWSYGPDAYNEHVLQDFRYLVEGEYSLEENDEWINSLQERPADKVCPS